MSSTWIVRSAPPSAIVLWNVVAAAALLEPNFSVPTSFVPTSAGAVPQVSVSGVELPPMLTFIAAAPAEKPPPLAVHWNVPPEVPRLRVKLTVTAAVALQHAAVEGQETADGNAGADVRLQRAVADRGAAACSCCVPRRTVVPGPFCTIEPPLLIVPLKVLVMPAAGTNCSVPGCSMFSVPVKFEAPPPSEKVPEQLTLIVPPPNQAPL